MILLARIARSAGRGVSVVREKAGQHRCWPVCPPRAAEQKIRRAMKTTDIV
jgi:hypothetical protein